MLKQGHFVLELIFLRQKDLRTKWHQTPKHPNTQIPKE